MFTYSLFTHGINSHEMEEVLTRYLIFASLPVAQQGSVSDMFPLVWLAGT